MKNTLPNPTPDFSKLVGVPYADKNCWDIAVEFYKDVLGHDLSSYYSGSTPPREVTKNLIFTNRGEFERVEIPQFGDIVILKLFGIECHIAVFVGRGKMLHTTRTSGSIVDRIDKWKHLVVGYYRVKGDR